MPPVPHFGDLAGLFRKKHTKSTEGKPRKKTDTQRDSKEKCAMSKRERNISNMSREMIAQTDSSRLKNGSKERKDSKRETDNESSSSCRSDKKGSNKAMKKLGKPEKQLIVNFSNTTFRKGVKGLKEDFNKRKRTNDPKDTTNFIQNALVGKNRYKDVACLDANRVVLRDWKTDYIHANFVSIPSNDRKFICTQGPMDVSSGDFWHMIVQERVRSIVMLCNILEKGMKKCFEYFPTAETPEKSFDGYVVKFVREKLLDMKTTLTEAKISVRNMSIFKDGQMVQNVAHFQWLEWPDRGVPKADLAIIRLLDAVRSDPTPVVVHCSAGIGRTGSVVMIEYARDAAVQGMMPESLDEIMDSIRKQRCSSVQTEQQYVFVHQVLLEYYKSLQIVRPSREMEKFVQEYNASLV
ncbi:hypothetical protein PENTCL1PPCAC_11640 [Pristionchus entomophagus]|uniref:Tyrosine phosphatase n=1 Tax=Pristionchus entomophagus TaxID=358040 RepID=A0AAV5T1W6_9BILA|nr:hypothetical protein PENTCL1PPCAC_11640 [Pristionchus entomophagus]